MKELLIMAKSLGGGGSEVALIELINALPEELYNITLVLLDSDNEYAYRLKKKVNIVQLTFNCSFAKSLVSMYAFPAKVLKKLSVNSFIPYYDFISNCVTNVFEKTYDVAIDFYGYGSFVTAFLATKIQAKKKATWIHDEKPYWMKSVQKYLCEYDKIYGVSQAVVDAFCREYLRCSDRHGICFGWRLLPASLETATDSSDWPLGDAAQGVPETAKTGLLPKPAAEWKAGRCFGRRGKTGSGTI